MTGQPSQPSAFPATGWIAALAVALAAAHAMIVVQLEWISASLDPTLPLATRQSTSHADSAT